MNNNALLRHSYFYKREKNTWFKYFLQQRGIFAYENILMKRVRIFHNSYIERLYFHKRK